MEARRASVAGTKRGEKKEGEKKINSKVVELEDWGEGDKEKGGALGRFVGVLQV